MAKLICAHASICMYVHTYVDMFLCIASTYVVAITVYDLVSALQCQFITVKFLMLFFCKILKFFFVVFTCSYLRVVVLSPLLPFRSVCLVVYRLMIANRENANSRNQQQQMR